MLVELLERNIDDRLVDQIVKELRKGELIIYPTDTVYAIGCDLYNKKALEKLASFKGVKLKKANFSIICPDLSYLSDYIRPIDRSTFKLLNRNTPGPFTFILEANNDVSRLFGSSKREIGIRIPDNKIIQRITEILGNPVVSTSLHKDDDIQEYFIDPYAIYEQHDKDVKLIIDGGYGSLEASTVIDLTSGEPVIIRDGVGNLQL